MALPQDEVPQSWRFTCPLAYVLVDGKQIANGEVDLVVKCEAGKSPAFAARHAEQPAANRHTLMAYVAKEAVPKLSLSLDGFLTPAGTVDDSASMRQSAHRRRLLIKGQSRLASTPIYDLRFSKARDLQDTISRLNRIGIFCEDDDKDLAAAPRSQSNTESRSQTSSPHFILSAEMMKAGRVMSPLQRRPDGSTPPFCLIQVPNSRQSTPRLSSQESVLQAKSQLSQSSQEFVPLRKQTEIPTARPPSVPAGNQRERYTTQLESIAPLLPIHVPDHDIESTQESATQPAFGSHSKAQGGPGHPKRGRAGVSTALDDSSSQPVKKRKVTQANNQKTNSQNEILSQVPASQTLQTQSRDLGTDDSEGLGQHIPPVRTTQAENPEDQGDTQSQVTSIMADYLWRGMMHQTMVWEELREGLIIDVDSAENDDQALETLVEEYQRILNNRVKGTCIS